MRSGARYRRWTVALLTVAFALVFASAAQATSGFSGTVSGAGNLDEVEVCIVEARPSETCTFPASSGSYSLVGVEPGTYQVEFLPSYRSHLVPQYYNGKAKLSEAIRVVVRSNLVTGGIDANLQLGGEIEGRVTEALGTTGLEEVEVCALGASDAVPVSCAHTDALGEYALPSIPPGLYRVGFWGEGVSSGYAAQYYDQKATFFDATPLSVAAGATTTGIDAGLAAGASVAGTVRSASGAPLAGIAVCILEASAASPKRCTDSGAAGEYRFAGLGAGTYQVVFSPEFSEFATEEFALPESDGWLTQYYDRSADRAGARPLVLTAGTALTGIDGTLSAPAAPPPSPPPPAATVAASPAPLVSEPASSKKCRRGYVRKKSKGVYRCVKAAKKKATGKKKHHHPKSKHKGER